MENTKVIFDIKYLGQFPTRDAGEQAIYNLVPQKTNGILTQYESAKTMNEAQVKSYGDMATWIIRVGHKYLLYC